MRLTAWKLSVVGLTFYSCFYYLIAMVSGACICPSAPTLWEVPCGSRSTRTNNNPIILNDAAESNNRKIWRRIIRDGLKRIREETRVARTLYLKYNFQAIFPTTKENMNDREYLPSWLPGIGDVETLSIGVKSIKEVPKSLQTYYTDLQKFAVAFEQTAVDQTHRETVLAIDDLNTGLSMVLCEIKSTLQDLQMSVPATIDRTVMPNAQRNITESDKRRIRDYATVRRYGDYVHQWTLFLQHIENRRRKKFSTSASSQNRRKRYSTAITTGTTVLKTDY